MAMRCRGADEDPFGRIDFTKGTLDDIGEYRNAFRNAVIADDLDVADAFLDHGMRVEPPDIRSGVGDILGDAAYFTRDPRMIRLLLAHGAKPGGAAHEWRSTVNVALKLGNKEIVDLLVAAGAECDPVWYDAAFGQLDDLKKRDASHPLDPKQIGQALDHSIDAGAAPAFDWLWAKMNPADPGARAKKLTGFYVRAAGEGHLPLMLRLEQMGVKPADGGPKALEEAVGGNHVAEAKHLFDLGAKLPPEPKESRGPLGDAAGEGRLEMVALLLDHGADINARDGKGNSGMTPLCWAAYSGQDEVCQLLVKRGADVNIGTDSGLNAAWHAAGSSHCTGALALMLRKGAQVTGLDDKGRTIIEEALSFSAPELGHVGFPGRVLSKTKLRDYEAREERTIDLLVSAGLDATGKEGTETPLMKAFDFNHYPAARAPLRNHAAATVKDAQGNTAINHLFGQWHGSVFPVDILETLLREGADPNQSFPIPGLTPRVDTTVLEEAMGSFREPGEQEVANQDAAVLALMKHGARFPGVKDADQALLCAAARGDLDGLEDALAKGASPDAKETFGYTALSISMKLGYLDNAFWLLDHGADPTRSLTMWGDSVLPNAVAAHRLDMVQLLIAKGVKPGDGYSGLDEAVRDGDRPMFDFLLKNGAKPSDANLFTCIQNGRADMARILLERGVDPQPPPIMENRANVFWAVCYGQPEILQMLLDHDADPGMKDVYGATPLSEAKRFHKEMAPVIEAAIRRRAEAAAASSPK